MSGLFADLNRWVRRAIDIRSPSLRRELQSLKDCHRGERAYLVGNGPSVVMADLDKLQGELSFCFNRFHLAYDELMFRPTYTVMADRQIIADFGREIARESEGQLVVASAYNPGPLDVDYLWLALRNASPFRFNPRVEGELAPGGSVLVVALQLAFHLGVRDVVLYGVDHRFEYEPIPGQDELVQGEGNHFIADYRGGRSWYPPNAREIDEALAECDRHYTSNGGRVRNATRGGKLEIFDRIDLDDALEEE